MNAKAFAAVRRATLWIPGTGPPHDPERGHLFIILTDPCLKGHVLLVPVCGAYKKYDGTCILGEGDHDFLDRKSYVAYYRLNTYAAVDLVAQVSNEVFRCKGMMDEKVFALVCNGVASSRDSAPKFKRYFDEQTKKGSSPP
jgi:hypothetical protein